MNEVLEIQSIKELSREEISQLVPKLKEDAAYALQWKPKNKREAMYNFAKAKAAEPIIKHLLKESGEYLSNHCKDCVNHIDPDLGVELVYREKINKVYDDEEIDALEEEIAKLKAKLKARKAIVEANDTLVETEEEKKMTREVQSTYWQAKF